MKINSFSTLLTATDVALGYIPVASTVTNLVDLFQKCVVLPMMKRKNTVLNHYYAYLDQKSFKRCISLLLPFVGNILFGIYDFAKRKSNQAPSNVPSAPTATAAGGLEVIVVERKASDVLTADNSILFKASDSERYSKQFVLRIVKQNGLELQFAPEKFKSDYDICKAAFEQNLAARKFADDTIKLGLGNSPKKKK